MMKQDEARALSRSLYQQPRKGEQRKTSSVSVPSLVRRDLRTRSNHQENENGVCSDERRFPFGMIMGSLLGHDSPVSASTFLRMVYLCLLTADCTRETPLQG